MVAKSPYWDTERYWLLIAYCGTKNMAAKSKTGHFIRYFFIGFPK